MKTLRIGIASYAEMKARTLAIARGKCRPAPNEPRVWFTSTESFARVLSAGNRALLSLIAEANPASLTELATLSGRKNSNLSRTLKAMERYGFIQLRRGPRGALAARVLFDSISLVLPLSTRAKDRTAA